MRKNIPQFKIEEIKNKEVDEEAVVCNVTPGEYTIEHYFNLSDENNLMYSKIYTNYER